MLLSHNHAPNSAKTQIGHIEGLASNVTNPFTRDDLRLELTRPINLRHLLPSEATRVQEHYANLSQITQIEKYIHTMTQLGSPFSKIWGDLTPS